MYYLLEQPQDDQKRVVIHFQDLFVDAEFQLANDNRGLIKDLGKLDENSPSDQIQQKKTLLAENDAAKTSMATIMKEYWTLFERLLGSGLVDAWQQIVQTETETIGYVAQDGTRVTGRVRGKRFDSMKSSEFVKSPIMGT